MAQLIFCPNPKCGNHENAPDAPWFIARGSYRTKAFGSVQRYRCKSCGSWFSSQTFSVDYYAKRVTNYREVLNRLVSSSSNRAIGRAMGISPDTVQNRIDRLARQALALQARYSPDANRYERICIDGVVSFDVSQYFPSEITIAITADSRFILDLSHTNRKRSGCKSALQKSRAIGLYEKAKLERGGISRTIKEIFETIFRLRPMSATKPLILTTDEKPDYSRILHTTREFRSQDETHRVIHQQINSRLPRTYWNPLHSSNYVEREIRKDLANHHRESACFSRNSSNMMNRLACYLGYHNFLKAFLIKSGRDDKRTHATAAGVPGIESVFVGKAFFSSRAFLSRTKLWPSLARIWLKESLTPMKSKPEYLPAYARA